MGRSIQARGGLAPRGGLARDRAAALTRRLAYGVLAAGFYLAAAWMTSLHGGSPMRPLYDGLAPPAPYRYVNPPPDLAEDNETPLRAVGTLLLGEEGSGARTVATADGQALVVFADGAVPPRNGEEEVSVRVTPIASRPSTQARTTRSSSASRPRWCCAIRSTRRSCSV